MKKIRARDRLPARLKKPRPRPRKRIKDIPPEVDYDVSRITKG